MKKVESIIFTESYMVQICMWKCVLIDVFLYLQITMDWLPDFKITMNPVVSLKRTLPVDYSLCIFCKTHQASVPLSQATDHGLAIVRNAADSRKKLRDTKNIDVIDRLENVFGSDIPKTLLWHRNCYGQFTDKNKIECQSLKSIILILQS